MMFYLSRNTQNKMRASAILPCHDSRLRSGRDLFGDNMPKRFVDTELYMKPWFRRLSPVTKCLWEYLRLRCNNAGIIELDLDAISFYVGAKITQKNIDELAGRILHLDDMKHYIIGFIEFQHGAIEKLSKNNNAHRQVIQAIEKYRLIEKLHEYYSGAREGLTSPCPAPVVMVEVEVEVDNTKLVNCNTRASSGAPSEIQQIVDYLNQKLGTRYKSGSDATSKHIAARLNEGFTVQDFCAVIDAQILNWGGTEMQKFLRPQTLFGPKFESYLNAAAQKTIERIDPLKQFFIASHPEAFHD